MDGTRTLDPRASSAPVSSCGLKALGNYARGQGSLHEPWGGTRSSPGVRTPPDDGVNVTLAKTAYLGRDFVLNVEELAGRSLAVVAQDGDQFVALASFCADLPRSAAELPLNVKLLVDCSESMSGDSIDAAKRALHHQFAGPDECAELRAATRGLLQMVIWETAA